jgi:pimeloyl-ACP methyl ester carboxylesterase
MEPINRHFEPREVVIAGRPMFYRRSMGPARLRHSGSCEIVLVHGLGLSGRYMLPLAARLAADHQVFLPDLPGFGDSSHPTRYSTSRASGTCSPPGSRQWT